MQQHFKLLGSGRYLPSQQLSAEAIDERLGLERGWTRRHVHVLYRYECREPEDLGSMAKEAAERALQDSACDWSEIDLIIDASTSKLQPIPFNAALLQQRFGPAAAGIPCMDVGSTCLSFVLALHVANALMASSLYQHILIVSSEAPLKAVNKTEPESYCLMGDGAAAVVLQKQAAREGFYFANETYGEFASACQLVGGLHQLPAFDYRPEQDAAYRFHMDGPAIFKVARQLLPKMLDTVLAQLPLEKACLRVIPHQASPRSLSLMRRSLGFSKAQFFDSVQEHGNLVAASIPFVLDKALKEKRLQLGDRVLLLGTSAGYSQAALIFQV